MYAEEGVIHIKLKPGVKKVGKVGIIVIWVAVLAAGGFFFVNHEHVQSAKIASLEARPAVVKEVIVTPSATPTASPSAKPVFKKVVPTVIPTQ